jgi:hypothetical protein
MHKLLNYYELYQYKLTYKFSKFLERERIGQLYRNETRIPKENLNSWHNNLQESKLHNFDIIINLKTNLKLEN